MMAEVVVRVSPCKQGCATIEVIASSNTLRFPVSKVLTGEGTARVPALFG